MRPIARRVQGNPLRESLCKGAGVAAAPALSTAKRAVDGDVQVPKSLIERHRHLRIGIELALACFVATPPMVY
jgi:hypothetical protein